MADKSAVLSTRISADLRDALEEAVRRNGLTLSREIEMRLRRSFERDRSIEEAYGSRQNRAVWRLITGVFDRTAARSDAPWLDPENFGHFVYSVLTILNALRPPGASLDLSKEEVKFFGELNASAVADDVLNADETMSPGSKNPFNEIKADLGDLTERLRALEGSGMGHGERAYIRRTKK